MLLIFVRRDAGQHHRFLRHVFAGQPVVIAWDRRISERRQPGRRVPGDQRRRDRRTSPLSLRPLPFIVVRPVNLSASDRGAA